MFDTVAKTQRHNKLVPSATAIYEFTTCPSVPWLPDVASDSVNTLRVYPLSCSIQITTASTQNFFPHKLHYSLRVARYRPSPQQNSAQRTAKMKAIQLSLLTLAGLGTVRALPLPDASSLFRRIDFSPLPQEGYNSMSVGGYTSTALSYLDPNHESRDALKKALSNPSHAYND